MREVNIATQTNGIGSWTAFRKKVHIIGLELEDGLLKAYFNPKDWDTYEHGDICTDEGWLESFRKKVVSYCADTSGIEYAPYAEQSEEYVALRVPSSFVLVI